MIKMILIIQIMLVSRQNKKYEATKRAMLIDCIRNKIRIDRRYTVYGIDIDKIIKDIIKRLGD